MELRTLLSLRRYPEFVRELQGIRRHGFYTEAREVVVTNGYEESTKYWVNLSEAAKPSFVDLGARLRDDKRDVRVWREYVMELASEFTYASPADRTMVLATMLTFICRPMIARGVPMVVVQAASPDSGKSLLVEIILFSILGRAVTHQPMNLQDEAETEKKLVTHVFGGADYIWLDNVVGLVDSPVLSSAVSAGSFTGRLLGTNTPVTVDSSVPFLLTENNPKLSQDTLARSVSSELVQTKADMSDRQFKNVNPELLAIERSGEIMYGLIRLVENWKAKGCPKFTKRRHAKFPSWSETIGGILEAAGIDNFMEGQEKYRSEGDPKEMGFRQFILEWWEQFFIGWKPSRELVGVAEAVELVNRDDPEGKKAQRMGTLLRQNQGRVFVVNSIVPGFEKPVGMEVRIQRMTGAHHVIEWRLAPVDEQVLAEAEEALRAAMLKVGV
jgi:hypothetical protein